MSVVLTRDVKRTSNLRTSKFIFEFGILTVDIRVKFALEQMWKRHSFVLLLYYVIFVVVLNTFDLRNVTFPKCAHLARKYLAIPATSTQSERLFSATGRLISKTRSRLLQENADYDFFEQE